MVPNRKTRPGAADVLREEATRAGFDVVRLAAMPPSTLDLERYAAWVADGFHADMRWMVDHLPVKTDPDLFHPGVRSLVMVGTHVYHPLPPRPDGLVGRVSRTLCGRDYHRYMAPALLRLGRSLPPRLPGLRWRGGVEVMPIYERSWAVACGVGFSGRNTCVVQPGRGSWLTLGALLTTEEVEPDPPLAAGCGSCRRCLDACPTGALVASGRLDARRCLSWATLECRGDLPASLEDRLDGWLCGCDACQDACPHNHAPPVSRHADLAPRPGLAWMDLPSLLLEDDEALETRTLGTLLRRAGAARLKRNAALLLGNLRDPAARPALEHALRHPDAAVGRAARRALDRL